MSAVEPVTNNRLLHLDSSGQGEEVVLVHGWGMHGAYWQSVRDALTSNYRVHCIDLPGHGKSAYQNEQTIDDFTEQLKRAIDSVSGQAVHLIGWSLGGLISQRLTLRYPDRIKTLGLIASSPCFVQRDGWTAAMRPDVLNSFAESLLQDYKITLNRFLALQVWGSENHKQELRALKQQLYSRGEPQPQALAVGLTLLRDIDLRDEIAAIDRPTMLLGGERDTLVPQAALSAMARQLRQASVHIIKGAGHAPFMSHPAEVIELLKAFLRHE